MNAAPCLYFFEASPRSTTGIDPLALEVGPGRWAPPSDLPAGAASCCCDCAVRPLPARCAGCPRPRPSAALYI